MPLRAFSLWAAGLLLLVGTACQIGPPELTAKEVLDRAADAAEKVNSAHFALEQQNGILAIGPGLQVGSAEGDVAQPDRVKLTFTLQFAGMNAETQVIGLGDEVFVTNPISKQWQRAPAGLSVPRVLDKTRGVPGLLRKVSDPQKVGNETLDGAQTQHIKGNVPAAAFTDMTGGEPTDGNVTSEVWVSPVDFLLRQVRLAGAISSGDTAETVRVLKFSKFNEPVSIERPV